MTQKQVNEGKFKKRILQLNENGIWGMNDYSLSATDVFDVLNEAKREFPHWKNYISKKDALEQYQSDCWCWFVKWFGDGSN